MQRPTQRKDCRKCGRLASEVGAMSHTGQCQECAREAYTTNYLDLVHHRGPGFHRWRRALAASVGGVLVDEGDDAS